MKRGNFAGLNDTSQEAENIQISLLRKLSPAQRAVKTFSLSNQVIHLSKRAIRRQNPHLDENELKILFLHHFYGPEIAEKVQAHLRKQ